MLNLSFDFNLFNNDYYFYERLVVLLFSLISTILLIAFVLYTDRKSKEPTKNIVVCLLSGILTTALASYLENISISYFSNSIVLIYVFAGIEELSKMAIFFLFIFDNKHYDDIYDGVIYMALIALSFAGVENVMYAFSESTVTNSIYLALMRDFTTIPLHVICGIIIGHFLSLGNFSKDKNKKYINFFLAFAISTIVHGMFNMVMTIIDRDYNSSLMILLFQAVPILIVMIILFYIATKYSKKSISLNEQYINNKPYEKKYDYLMNNDEYLKSSTRNKRIKMYNKTNFRKNEKDDV